MKENECSCSILEAVEEVNQMQKISVIPKIKELVEQFEGKKIAVWGLAFKPKTDDIREAPALSLITKLIDEGCKVSAFDPVAEENAKGILKDVNFSKTPYDALNDADCLVIMTEWDEFRSLDKKTMKVMMKQPNIVDGRNIYDLKEMQELGFNYRSIGR
jgi:UDPglucose 6-dehydrogenase